MKYNPDIHHRRSIRLKNYDYSRAGLYFVTICVNHRLSLFGQIVNGEMVLNNAGKMIEKWWIEMACKFARLVLHEFVVMPNHFHGIVEIEPKPVGGRPMCLPCNESNFHCERNAHHQRRVNGGRTHRCAPT